MTNGDFPHNVEHRTFRASTDSGENHEEKETKEENTDSESKSSDDTRTNRTVLLRFRRPRVKGLARSDRVAYRSVTDPSDPMTTDPRGTSTSDGSSKNTV